MDFGLDFSTDSSMDSSMDSDMKPQPVPFEVWDYYEKVSKGLIEERPYDYWGPESEEEKAHWDQWWLPITKSFRRIDWDSGFTGRGIAKHNKKAMERPGIVGPKGELLVMEVDPLLNTLVWRVDGNSSSEAELSTGIKKRRGCCLKAASSMCKRAKNYLATFIEVHRRRTGRTPLRGRTATPYPTESMDRY